MGELLEVIGGLDNVAGMLPVEEVDGIRKRLFEAAEALGAAAASTQGESPLRVSSMCVIAAAEKIDRAEELLSEARKGIDDYAVSIGAGSGPDKAKPDINTSETVSGAMDEIPKGLRALVSESHAIGFYRNLAAQAPRLTQEQRTELCTRIESGLYARQLLREPGRIAQTWQNPALADNPPTKKELRVIAEEGEAAFKMMVLANMPLVLRWAPEINADMPCAEKLRHGVDGLIQAVRKFDFRQRAGRGPNAGECVRFSPYAHLWIKQAVERADAKANAPDYGLSIADYMRRRYIFGTTRQLIKEQGRRPTDEEIAQKTSYPVKDVRWLRTIEKEKPPATVYLDDERAKGPGWETNYEFIPDTSPDSGPNDIHKVELRQVVRSAIGSLKPHEMHLLDMYLGLSG